MTYRKISASIEDDIHKIAISKEEFSMKRKIDNFFNYIGEKERKRQKTEMSNFPYGFMYKVLTVTIGAIFILMLIAVWTFYFLIH